MTFSPEMAAMVAKVKDTELLLAKEITVREVKIAETCKEANTARAYARFAGMLALSVFFGLAMFITAFRFDWTRFLESDQERTQRLAIEQRAADEMLKIDPAIRLLIEKTGAGLQDCFFSQTAERRADGLRAMLIVMGKGDAQLLSGRED